MCVLLDTFAFVSCGREDVLVWMFCDMLSWDGCKEEIKRDLIGCWVPRLNVNLIG